MQPIIPPLSAALRRGLCAPKHLPAYVYWPLPYFRLLAAISLFALSVPTANATQFNVLSYGSTGNGTSDDTAAINSAIDACVLAGTGNEVYLPAGTYRLGSAVSNYSLRVNSGNGITIRGTPTTVLLSDSLTWAMLQLNNCNNVTLQSLTLDRKSRGFTQGTITAIDPVAKTCTVTIDPGYDEADSTYILPLVSMLVFTYPDSETYQQDISWPKVSARTKLATRSWKFTFGSAPPANALGARYVLWDGIYRGNGIISINGQNTLVQDVNYWARGANAGLYFVGSKGTTTFRRVKLDVPAGSGDLFSSGGGGQIADTRGTLVYDDCDIAKVDDDGADVLTTYRRVLSQTGTRAIQVQNSSSYQVGDTMTIVDWNLKQERSTAVVTAVSAAGGGASNVTFDRDVTILRAGAGDDSTMTAAITDGVDRVIDYSMACAGLTVTNCRLQSYRARPLNLKAQNILIENCTFHGTVSPAIMAGPEFYFPEGPALHGLTIRNNRFINCVSANIHISYLDTLIQCHSRDNKTILIEGNTFTNYAAHGTTLSYPVGPAIYVANADGVTIQNNDFSQPAALAPQGMSRVLIEESDNVTVAATNKGLLPTIVLGSILREYWSDVAGTAVSAIPVYTSPSGSSVLTSFESPVNFAESYGARVRGYVVPPATGAYTFWIASDDSGELWLSTDDSSINKRKIAFTTTATASRQWNNNANQKSAPVNLVAGTPYYIEALQKEAGGGDNLAVGWAKPGEALTGPSEIIPGTVLGPYIRDGGMTYDYWTNISGTAISSIPVGTAPAGSYVLHNNLEGLMNWADNYGSQTSGYLVPPVTGNYTFWLAADDTGELWLSSDTTAANKQRIAYTTVATGSRQWTASASQKSAAVSLVAGKFYYVQVLQKEGGGGDHFAVGWAKPGEAVTGPSEVVPGSALGVAPRAGAVLLDTWTNLPGATVADIPLNTLPANTTLLSSMESPPNRGDYYGDRIRGTLVAPIGGLYTFWIASDDAGELWLSTTALPASKVRIAYVSASTGSRQWGACPSQKSAAINLAAGQSYYIEAVHKEAGGGDNLAVGWARPGQSTAAPSEVVPGSVLALPPADD